MKNFEHQYAESLEGLLKYGVKQTNRTGVATYVKQHQYFYLKDVANRFPSLKAKKVFPKLALKEMLWFMMGRTDVAWLNEVGVNYWNEWADKNGTIGKSYGYQFRNFNGADPLQDLINEMVNNPESRRMMINIWNHADLKEMTLPPCAFLYHFENTKVNSPFNKSFTTYYVDLHVTQRSADSFLGVPYNFMSASWLLMLVVEIVNSIVSAKGLHHRFAVRDIHHTCNNFHIYENHVEQAHQYLTYYYRNNMGVCDIPTKASCSNLISGHTWEGVDLPKVDLFLENIRASNFSGFNVEKPVFDYGKIEAPIAV